MARSLDKILTTSNAIIDKSIRDNCIKKTHEELGVRAEAATEYYCCPQGLFVRAKPIEFEYYMGIDVVPSGKKIFLGDWIFYSSKLDAIANALLTGGINIED